MLLLIEDQHWHPGQSNTVRLNRKPQQTLKSVADCRPLSSAKSHEYAGIIVGIDAGSPHMPRTDAKIRSTKPAEKPVKVTSGAAVYLDVRPTCTNLWRYRYCIAGSENVYAVGEYGDTASKGGLAEARKAALVARALVIEGVHPAHNRQTLRLATHAGNANTFETVVRE